MMFLSLQNSSNSVLYCGPLSDLKRSGQPNVLNQFVRTLIIAEVESFVSFSTKGKPEYLSTKTSSYPTNLGMMDFCFDSATD